MCGFGGIISWEKKISLNKLRTAASKVSFRGPDHTGIKLYDSRFGRQDVEGEVGLFFNRLAIIDLDQRANQPFENERYILLFNGEIYNYKKIRNELLAQGVSFATSSDTEVLFHALIKYGIAAISKLNGMFAFVFINKAERKILFARDRAGIKPLNFLINSTGLTFASEIDSIIRLSEEKPALSKGAVGLYLSLQYVPTPFTIWEGIYRLPPGTYVEESIDQLPDKRELTPLPYWDAYEQANGSPAENGDLEQLLYNSLESQLQSDVPLGLFLSSGIDSSLLAALINKHFGKEKQFDFFTVAFDEKLGKEADEYKDAKIFLSGFKNKNFIHHALHVNPSVIQDEFTSMYGYLDEPFGDYAVMLNYLVSKKAKEHVTVVLSGDGSDELFWGYPRYNSWIRQQQGYWRYFGLTKKLIKLAPEISFKRNWLQKLTTDPAKSYINLVSSGYFSTDSSFSENDYWWSQGIKNIRTRGDLPSLIDFKTYLPDCMLYKVDRSSMGASLEVRVPFMDNHIIDFALQMNIRKKSTPKHATKSPLKEMLLNLAPHYQFNLPKKGFSLPLKDWISNQWKDIAFSSTVSGHLESFDLGREYNFLLTSHYQQGKDRSIEIWRLLNFALWLETKKQIL